MNILKRGAVQMFRAHGAELHRIFLVSSAEVKNWFSEDKFKIISYVFAVIISLPWVWMFIKIIFIRNFLLSGVKMGDYNVTVFTGDLLWAGTSNKVYITLVGTEVSSIKKQ